MDGAAAPALATRAIAQIRIAIMRTPNTLLQFGRLNATLAGRPVSGRMSDVAGLLARWEPRVKLVPESRQGCALVRSQDCLNYTVITSVTRGRDSIASAVRRHRPMMPRTDETTEGER